MGIIGGNYGERRLVLANPDDIADAAAEEILSFPTKVKTFDILPVMKKQQMKSPQFLVKQLENLI